MTRRAEIITAIKTYLEANLVIDGLAPKIVTNDTKAPTLRDLPLINIQYDDGTQEFEKIADHGQDYFVTAPISLFLYTKMTSPDSLEQIVDSVISKIWATTNVNILVKKDSWFIVTSTQITNIDDENDKLFCHQSRINFNIEYFKQIGGA